MNYVLVKVQQQDNLIGKLRVLSIDDNHQNLNLIQQALEEHFDVISSTGDESVEELVADCEPHIILLDIMLTDKSGYDVCSTLRDKGLVNNTIIIFISSLSSLSDKLKAYEAGGDDYICKPVNLAELEYKLEACEKRINAHRALKSQVENACSSVSLQQSNELAVLLEFVAQSVDIDSFDQLHQTAQEIFSKLQLSCVMAFRTESGSYQYPADNISQLESEILDLGKRANREVSFGKNLLFNTKQCSLLVKQMPDTASGLGHTRELLAIVLETLSSRIRYIDKNAQREQAIKALQSGVEKTFSELDAALIDLQGKLYEELDNLRSGLASDHKRGILWDEHKRRVDELIEDSIDISGKRTQLDPLLYKLR